MKKFLLLVSLSLLLPLQAIYASLGDTPETEKEAAEIKAKESVSVQTSEYVPGAGCACIAGGTKGEANKECAPGTKIPKYECSVGKGLTSFQGMIATIVSWFVKIVLLLGVLAIVGAGILMSFGSESEEYTKKAKGWAVNIIIGLIILFTFRYILGLLAPWIYQ